MRVYIGRYTMTYFDRQDTGCTGLYLQRCAHARVLVRERGRWRCVRARAPVCVWHYEYDSPLDLLRVSNGGHTDTPDGELMTYMKEPIVDKLVLWGLSLSLAYQRYVSSFHWFCHVLKELIMFGT